MHHFFFLFHDFTNRGKQRQGISFLNLSCKGHKHLTSRLFDVIKKFIVTMYKILHHRKISTIIIQFFCGAQG
eukprot:UN00159